MDKQQRFLSVLQQQGYDPNQIADWMMRYGTCEEVPSNVIQNINQPQYANVLKPPPMMPQ